MRPGQADRRMMMMTIPSFSLARQIEALGPTLSERINEVVSSGQFILGSAVAEFEDAMRARIGVADAVAVANGSDALYLALLALGIGPGDEVVTTPFTFFATAGSIARTGATPVFCDIDADTFNMSPARALDRVTSRTRAILPVHLFGLMADVRTIAHGFAGPVVEDAAQAIDASGAGSAAGSAGALGCFSFFPTKNLGAFGDAGLVTAWDPELGQRIRRLRVHGSRKKYYHEDLGINSRMDTLQAAVLLAKLPHLAEWTARRRALANRYTEGFRASQIAEVVVPTVPDGFVHVFHQYTVRAVDRDALAAYLREQGIGTTVYYPVPLHLQPAFRSLGYRPGDFPVSERAAAEVLSLPMFPELREDEVDRVVEMVGRFYGRGG